ncbi:MAG: SDR family oxidoreductase [Ruminococcaceae bacterium]|nr:SDR family oxidoreductase [Oscillospiraceae bacterium]
MGKLDGKVAVVTAGGGVLCSCFAKELAANGAKVAVLDLDEKAAQETAKAICEAGGEAISIAVNALKKESLESAREQIHSKFGKCDILINGVGGNSPRGTTDKEYYEDGDIDLENVKTFFDLEPENLGFVFNINLIAVMLTTQVFAQDMLGREECTIVNISSMNAFRPLTKIPAYSTAKAAVSNFTQWLAVHFAKQGIRVNAIAPGFFVTKQNKDLLYDANGNPTARTGKILAATPMGRFGQAQELLGTLMWLVDSKASSFVTGIVVPVDGGFSAYSGV